MLSGLFSEVLCLVVPGAVAWCYGDDEGCGIVGALGEETVKGVDVYWFDDDPEGHCRVPAVWKVQTQLGEMTGWEDVATDCPIVKGDWSRVTFAKPVPAVSIRLQVKLQPKFSAGICELRLR